MKLKYVLYGSIPLLLVILGIMYPISGFKDLPSILVAWGTLMLAIATFSLIWQTIEHEKSRKQDELNRENRLRKEGWLDDILDWASHIQTFFVTTDISFVTLTGQQLFTALYMSLQNQQTQSEYIKCVADTLDNTLDKKLKASVEDSSSKLDLCIKALTEVIELAPKSPSTQVDPAIKKFVERMVDAQQSANQVIKLTSNMKTSLLSQ